MNDRIKLTVERIQETRLNRGMSFQELSDKTGFSKSVLQRYESGEIKKLPIDRLEIIANALGVSPEWLMGFDAPKRGEKETVRAKAEENLDEYDKKIIEQLPNLSPDQKTALFTMIEAFHKGNQ